jgi:hypothetical protein
MSFIELESIQRTIDNRIAQPIERYRERLTEPSGRGQFRTYLLLFAAGFAAIGFADVAVNIFVPTLKSLDGAAATGFIATVSGAVSAKI